MSESIMKMGPEEEFEFHNRQNSWPILFEVYFQLIYGNRVIRYAGGI